MPAFRGESDRDRLRFIARRFGVGTLMAIAVLLATGVPPASHFRQWEDGTLHVKLALVAVIFVGSLAIAWLGVSLAH